MSRVDEVELAPAAWVVSPHLLVAQAVSAALSSAGAPVEARVWETVVQEARSEGRLAGTRHVVAIVDELDTPAVVAQVSQLISVGDVHVAVVTSDVAATRWGELLDHECVDVVTSTTSLRQLTEMVERLTAGEALMTTERRVALHEAWSEALDRRRHVMAMVRTLTPQQLRVLELLSTGRRVREVAAMLEITDGTVRDHVKSLREKLGARTQLEAVAMLREVYEVRVPVPRR